jgi:hypothetical protein
MLPHKFTITVVAWIIFWITAVSTLTWVLCDVFVETHNKYIYYSTKLEHDWGMIKLCKNETIGSTISNYVDLCLNLESNARIGPFWLAVTSVTWGRHLESLGSGLMDVAGLTCISSLFARDI